MGKTYRGAGTIRWAPSDGHSPYIGENGNWWQWNDIIGDFVDTGVSAKGVDGMPGKVPIQKEWKVGDTHRNDTNIVDFIYVRAALSADRKWYRLNDNYVTRTVPAGETEPSAATIAEYYEEIPWLSELAVNVLIAEEANLANFIFKEGKLISLRGTVDGVEVDYAGQANFIPNLVLDGESGTVTVRDGVFNGKVTSSSDGNRVIIDPDDKSVKLIDSNDETLSNIGFKEVTEGSQTFNQPYIEQLSPSVYSFTPKSFFRPSYIELTNVTGFINTSFVFDAKNSQIILGLSGSSPGTLKINIKNLPTSDSGLSAGDLYRDSSGYLKTV